MESLKNSKNLTLAFESINGIRSEVVLTANEVSAESIAKGNIAIGQNIVNYETDSFNNQFTSNKIPPDDIVVEPGGRYLLQIQCCYLGFPPRVVVRQQLDNGKVLESKVFLVGKQTLINFAPTPRTVSLQFLLEFGRNGEFLPEIEIKIIEDNAQFRGFRLAMFGKVFQNTVEEKLLSIEVRNIEAEKLESAWRLIEELAPDWIKYKKMWMDFYNKEKILQQEQIPWASFPFIEWLSARLEKGMKVFEWGSGSSTLFFLKHGAEVISVEHERKWHDIVSETLSMHSKRNNLHYYLVEPIALENSSASDLNYRSGKSGCEGLTFRDYVECVKEYQADYFDVVFVDGRARLNCIEQAVAKVKKGGLLILDNSDYIRYEPQLSELRRYLLAGWQEEVFAGPLPALGMIGGRTTVWQRS